MGETFTVGVTIGNLEKGTIINSTDKISSVIKTMCYTIPDPPTDYESTLIATWNSTNDVDSFFNTYSWKNGWAGLKLGNLIQINDGTYNKQWEIAGFNLEHNQTAADETVYNNGYGLCLIPKTKLTDYRWGASHTNVVSYINSDIHSYINGTIYNALNIVCGSHIINRNVLLGSSNGDSSPRYFTTSAYTWTTAYLTLMSVGQCINSFASYNNKYDDGEANYYLPVFSHENYYITSDFFWSRCVYGSYGGNFAGWAITNGYTYYSAIDHYYVDGSIGVRPLMYLR